MFMDPAFKSEFHFPFNNVKWSVRQEGVTLLILFFIINIICLGDAMLTEIFRILVYIYQNLKPMHIRYLF